MDTSDTNSTEKPARPQNDRDVAESLADQSEEAPPARQLHGLSWSLVVASILTTTFLFGLDNTIVADVQPAIVAQFGSVDRLPWLSVAFLVSAASTTVFWGQMYAQWNAKWLYISCIIIFEVGSALCGAAPDMTALIVGRAICGFGGIGMYTGVLNLLSILSAENERALYFALSGLVWGVGTVLGPIIGGAFTSSSAGWRWAFYINLCVAAACAPVYLFKIPSIQPRPDTPLLKRAAEIDLGGTILLTGLYLSGLMAISFGGVLYAWGSGQIVATFVVAGVLALIFLAQQIWSIGTLPERRAFPLQFFKNGTLTTVFLLECCASTLTYIPIYFVPLYFQFAKQDSAITAGVRLLPLVVFLVTAIVVNGFAVTATGKWLPWFFAGAALALIGSALLYTVDLTTSNAKLYGYTILTGAGSGCFLQLPFSVVQSLVPPETIPKAIGFVTFAQLSAPAIVLSVVNAVFLNEAGNSIASSIPTIPRDTINSILSGVGSTEFTQLDSTAQLQVVESIVAGLSKGYIVSITSGGLALVLSMWLLFVSKRAKSQAQTGP